MGVEISKFSVIAASYVEEVCRSKGPWGRGHGSFGADGTGGLMGGRAEGEQNVADSDVKSDRTSVAHLMELGPLKRSVIV